MKIFGIVRKLDNLGRLVIPKEILNRHNIKALGEVEILDTTEGIIVKKHTDVSLEDCIKNLVLEYPNENLTVQLKKLINQ